MVWLLILGLLSIFECFNASCPTIKNCLHNGIFNNKTCECECHSSYKGNILIRILSNTELKGLNNKSFSFNIGYY